MTDLYGRMYCHNHVIQASHSMTEAQKVEIQECQVREELVLE